MLNNLTNFFNLITGKMIKTKAEPSDLITLGTRDSRYGGNYKPTAMQFSDFKAQITETSASLDDLKLETWTFDFMDALTYTTYAPYDLKITQVTNVVNAPTTVITDDGLSYTLEAKIATGSAINVTVDTASVVVLKITKL